MRFIKNWLNLIDLFSFLPFYIELTNIMSGTAGLRVVRTIRLSRMVRMMKFELFAEYMLIFSNTLSFAKHSFGMLGVLLLFPLVICSCLMFSVEEGGKSHFVSIFDAMYWTIITMTTLGYGDQYPNTVIGKIISCITVIMGIMYLTFAINIIGSCFDEAYGRYLKRLSKKKKAAIRRIVETEDEKAGNKHQKSLLNYIPSEGNDKNGRNSASMNATIPDGFENMMVSLNEMMLALLLSKNGTICWNQGRGMLLKSFIDLQQQITEYSDDTAEDGNKSSESE
jgi:small neutral amino acid transporter SnatA (MarC family)